MDYPSIKNAVIADLLESLVLSNNVPEVTFLTSMGLISGIPCSPNSCDCEPLFQKALKAVEKHRQDNDLEHKTIQGNDGFIMLRDAKFLSSSGITQCLSNAIVFVDQIAGIIDRKI